MLEDVAMLEDKADEAMLKDKVVLKDELHYDTFLTDLCTI